MMNTYKHPLIAALLILSPVTTVAGSLSQYAEGEVRYFVGLKGGASVTSNSDRVVLSGGETFEASDSDVVGFGGISLGLYSMSGNSRIYYSGEYHQSEVKVRSVSAYDVDSYLHTLNADYMFNVKMRWRPFVGMHFGYASVESSPSAAAVSSFKQNGTFLGIQTGMHWQASDFFTVELGIRHSALPSDIEAWSATTNSGDTVTVESQKNGITSGYLAVNYQF